MPYIKTLLSVILTISILKVRAPPWSVEQKQLTVIIATPFSIRISQEHQNAQHLTTFMQGAMFEEHQLWSLIDNSTSYR